MPCTRNCPDLSLDPCVKINGLLAAIPAAQPELASMATQVSDTSEHGRYKLTRSNVVQTPPTGTNGAVSFPTPASGAYIMHAHTHNSPANTTLSVFSWFDLEAIAKLMKQGKISPDCVFFLATADGTNYAFTIDDQVKFSQFFAIGTDPDFDMEIGIQRAETMKKYYDVGNVTGTPLIKEDSTNNLVDEKAFLDMLADNNMGASLLEANSNFTSFNKVVHDKATDTIVPTPCN